MWFGVASVWFFSYAYPLMRPRKVEGLCVNYSILMHVIESLLFINYADENGVHSTLQMVCQNVSHLLYTFSSKFLRNIRKP